MSVRVKLYNPEVNEEEVDQNQNQEQTTNNNTGNEQNSESDKLKQQYAEVQGKIAFLDKDYNAKKQPLLTQLAAIKNTAAKLGVILAESTVSNFDFSTKLYESVMSTGKTDELINIIDATFKALPDLSYYMDKKGCTSLAKRMLAYLNDQYWNDGQNHWADVADFVSNTIGRANISLSTKEVNKFIDELENQMGGNTMFVWIFGNSANNQPVEEPVEEYPADDYPTEEGPITPEDEEVLADYAQPMEEIPEETYDEDEVLPEETANLPITPEDEDSLMQYATDYDDYNVYDEYELNEELGNSICGVPIKKIPKVLLEPEMPDELAAVTQEFAEGVASALQDVPMDEFENEVYEYIKYAGDEFWDCLADYIGDDEKDNWDDIRWNNRRMNQELHAKIVWEVWGSEICQIFLDAMNDYYSENKEYVDNGITI